FWNTPATFERTSFVGVEARLTNEPAAYRECLIAGCSSFSLLVWLDERGIRGTTVVGNSVSFGSVVHCSGAGPTANVLRNVVLADNASGNQAGVDAQIRFSDSGDPPDVGWSFITDWTPADGGVQVLSGDPVFADPLGPDGVPFSGDEDHAPGPGSPLIDAGGPRDEPAGSGLEEPAVDLRRLSRRVDDLLVPDTGPGPSPVVDIGAIERQGD
ncbi:MAG: hypothetical protein AAFP86_21990, partial [Planctomycetota bacterium]